MNIRTIIKSIKVVALAIAGATTFYSCAEAESEDRAIFSNPLITVSADSVAISGKNTVRFLSGDTLVTGTDTISVKQGKGNPVFRSSIPILDAAFAQGLTASRTILEDTVPPHLIDCLELFSLTNPEECISRLDEMVADSIITAPSPAYTGRGLWVTAATEAGMAAGNREWLAAVCNIGERTLAMEHRIAYNSQQRLICGIPMTHMGVNDYLPRWMTEVDRFERFTLMSNVVSAGAFRALAQANAICSGSDPTELLAKAQLLSHSINIRLWQPDAGMYNRFLYTDVYPIPARITDNAAQPLAIIFGVATPEMADKILASTPWYQAGIPLFYPSPAGTPVMNFNYSYPRVLSLWALAAADRGNETVLSASLGYLLAKSFGKEADPVASMQVTMCALRIFTGIKVSDNALVFNPVVPEFLKDGFELSEFRYRNSELTIKVKGSGNKIVRFTIDGEAKAHPIFNASLNGKHTITIILSGNPLEKTELPAQTQKWAPPVPEIEHLSPRICKIEGAILRDVRYVLYRNGTYYSMIDSTEFHLPDIEEFSEYCVIPIGKDNIQGFCSAPYFHTPAGSVKTLQAEDFAPGGTSHIRGWRPSLRYVESSPRDNSAIEFIVRVAEPALYIARICYANGNGAVNSGDACALRSIRVNGTTAGTFVLPARGDGWWLSSGFSNSVQLRLNKGENRITVEYDPDLYPGNSSTDVLIDYLRLVRLSDN
ncbi:MAG: hypothetical protein K2K52_08025 [Paramuribaculum sp.]|nr:hypothetical protein [Paramuribaculum sp.]